MYQPLSPNHPHSKNLAILARMLYLDLNSWAPNRQFTLGDLRKELRRRSTENTLRIDGSQTIKQKLDGLVELRLLDCSNGLYSARY